MIFRCLTYIVIIAFLVAGCAEVSRALLLPGELVVYVGDRPYPSDFDPYYNQPKKYKGRKVFKTTKGLCITALDNKDWDANILLDGKVLAAGGSVQVRFKNDAQSRTWDFNLVDDEGLSVTFDKVKLAGVDTVTLKDVNGQITAEIE